MSILARIQANGGDVIVDEYRIRIKRGRLSDEALAWIAERKEELHLAVWPLYADWQERAAIREFDGGQDRDHAEREAYREVMAR